MEVHQKEVEGSERKIPYTYIQNGSTRICFMFAGRGYNYDRPLFYYTTMKLIEDTCDVVHVHYDYEPSFFEQPWEGIAKQMEEDVSSVIEDVLKQKDDVHLCFLGKSIGTVPMAEGLIRKYPAAKYIFLTPLFKYNFYEEPLIQTSADVFIFVGDQDYHCKKDVIDKLKNRSNVRIELLENANHSLDIAGMDTSRSIEVIKQVVESIGVFMKE